MSFESAGGNAIYRFARRRSSAAVSPHAFRLAWARERTLGPEARSPLTDRSVLEPRPLFFWWHSLEDHSSGRESQPGCLLPRSTAARW